MKGILKRHWSVIFFTTIYLIFITDIETPDKYIYIFVLCLFIMMIDIFLEKITKNKK